MLLTLSSMRSRMQSYHSQADSAGLIAFVTHPRSISTATKDSNTTTTTTTATLAIQQGWLPPSSAQQLT
jgi:hypothetical protein